MSPGSGGVFCYPSSWAVGFSPLPMPGPAASLCLPPAHCCEPASETWGTAEVPSEGGNVPKCSEEHLAFVFSVSVALSCACRSWLLKVDSQPTSLLGTASPWVPVFPRNSACVSDSQHSPDPQLGHVWMAVMRADQECGCAVVSHNSDFGGPCKIPHLVIGDTFTRPFPWVCQW